MTPGELAKWSQEEICDVTEIVEEWRKQPYVSLTVEKHFCPGGSEPLFTKTWGGTESGCRVDTLKDPDCGPDGTKTESDGATYSTVWCNTETSTDVVPSSQCASGSDVIRP